MDQSHPQHLREAVVRSCDQLSWSFGSGGSLVLAMCRAGTAFTLLGRSSGVARALGRRWGDTGAASRAARNEPGRHADISAAILIHLLYVVVGTEIGTVRLVWSTDMCAST